MKTRRDFIKLAGATTGLTFMGFNSTASADILESTNSSRIFQTAPLLEGKLITDAKSCAKFGQDVGFVVFNKPIAVLCPGSISDVQRMVRFCYIHGIPIVARGQGHSTDGQSQVDAGLVIDMRTLNTVHEIKPGYAVVDAGSTWRNLLEHTLKDGQSPPVLTGFIGLSIGGTLSMGGISGMSYKRGVQVDQVLELTVVTGSGDIEVCSREQNPELFNAVLAGIGQYGIIVQAKLRLMPIPTRSLDWTIRYEDLAMFLADMRILVEREELDKVWGGMKRDPASSKWFYELYTSLFYDAPSLPDMAYLHRNLSYTPGTQMEIDSTYIESQTQVDNFIAYLQSNGKFEGFMHPWFDTFLPDKAVESYIETVLPKLSPEDVGIYGFVLLFPLKRSTAQQPLFRLPDDDLVFLFDILTVADSPGFNAAYASQMVEERNRLFYDQALSVGGTRYPIGSLRFNHQDWRKHYGQEWSRIKAAKTKFDPKGILTPGLGIF
ncbi:MAG TPA: FAD-binding protein [Leptolyngbyaceae cyanobacterium]